MINPDRLLSEVLEEAKALSLPVSSHILPHVEINHRAKTRFGRCIRRSGSFTIELSARLLEAEAEQSCRQTLAHEVLHTCPGCQNHQARWKSYALRMNKAYGYHIERTSRPEELGLMANADLPTRPIRYRLRCNQCGVILARMKKSSLILHPEWYRCRCGGAFSRLSEEAQEK